MIANEAVDSRIKQKKPGILDKLDIVKAYDHVNCRYLIPTEDVGKHGLWAKKVEMDKVLISTIKFSVLINGAPTKNFNTQRRLRQGDLLSPFLFLITM